MLFVRCDQLTKAGLGEIHLHRRWWSRKTAEVLYNPEGTNKYYRVPPSKFPQFIHATSVIEAMSIIRKEDA